MFEKSEVNLSIFWFFAENILGGSFCFFDEKLFTFFLAKRFCRDQENSHTIKKNMICFCEKKCVHVTRTLQKITRKKGSAKIFANAMFCTYHDWKVLKTICCEKLKQEAVGVGISVATNLLVL